MTILTFVVGGGCLGEETLINDYNKLLCNNRNCEGIPCCYWSPVLITVCNISFHLCGLYFDFSFDVHSPAGCTGELLLTKQPFFIPPGGPPGKTDFDKEINIFYSARRSPRKLLLTKKSFLFFI